MKNATKLFLANIVLVSIIAFFVQNREASSSIEASQPTRSIEVLPEENETDSQKNEVVKARNSDLQLVNDDTVIF